MSCNFKNMNNLSMNYLFNSLPENGEFVWKKGVTCKPILKEIPESWNWDRSVD